jgi:hypothetical protein
MKKRNVLLIGAGLALASTVAIAGFTQPAEVDIIKTPGVGGSGSGDQTTARYNSDPDVFIGCGMRRTVNSVGVLTYFGFCQGKDAADDTVTCFTTNPALVDAIHSSGDFGFITFAFKELPLGPGETEPSYECTRIGFSNQSFYLPKKLDRN